MDSPTKTKVFYIAQFVRGYEECVVWALRQHGIDVQTFSWQHSHRNLVTSLEKDKPDFVLFSKPQPTRAQDLLEQCRRLGIITVTWVWDLYWGFRGKRPYQFHSDILLTTDGGHQQDFDAHGYNHSVLRQGIHQPDHVFYNRNPAYDVAFIGGSGRFYHTERGRLVSWLSSTYGRRFKQYTDVRRLALNRELARVKVVVGDSYPSPNYWSNRIYEVIGRGGFFLHPDTQGLDSEFTEGKHYIKYQRGNFVHLKQLIDHWVGDNKQRETICREGFDYCGANYTYTNRVTKLLETVENYRRKVQSDSR